MTREQLLELHKELSQAAHSLMVKKNTDYAGTGDALANFNVAETFGIPRELGIVTRLLDKVKRVSVFLKAKSFAVSDEGLRDTILDMLNYTVILYAALTDKGHSMEKGHSNADN